LLNNLWRKKNYCRSRGGGNPAHKIASGIVHLSYCETEGHLSCFINNKWLDSRLRGEDNDIDVLSHHAFSTRIPPKLT